MSTSDQSRKPIRLPHRRNFLASCASALAGTTAARLLAQDRKQTGKTIEIDVVDGAALQSELDRHAGTGNLLQLKSARDITCLVQEQMFDGEKSIHPLLVPPGVHLDLQGATLLLDCRSNSYGLRLSNDSSIRNGTIKVVR